jgi:hypothetical protein
LSKDWSDGTRTRPQRSRDDSSVSPSNQRGVDRDGFRIVEDGLVSDHALERLRERYQRVIDFVTTRT